MYVAKLCTLLKIRQASALQLQLIKYFTCHLQLP